MLPAVLVALGDAALEVPDLSSSILRRDLPLSFEGEAFSDQEVLLKGEVALAQQLSHEYAHARLRYLVVAPAGGTFLQAARRSKLDDSMVGFDGSVRRIALAVARALPDWRLLVLSPGSSSFQSGPSWSALRASAPPSTWQDEKLDSTPHGGKHGMKIVASARGFATQLCSSSSSPPASAVDSWADVAGHAMRPKLVFSQTCWRPRGSCDASARAWQT